METNDKSKSVLKKEFPIKTFLLCFVAVAIVLYLLTPLIRNYDYGSITVTQYDYQNTLLLKQQIITKPASIVSVEGNIHNDGTQFESVQLHYDNINCYPKEGRYKLAGYWSFYNGLPEFNAVWVIDGC